MYIRFYIFNKIKITLELDTNTNCIFIILFKNKVTLSLQSPYLGKHYKRPFYKSTFLGLLLNPNQGGRGQRWL